LIWGVRILGGVDVFVGFGFWLWLCWKNNPFGIFGLEGKCVELRKGVGQQWGESVWIQKDLGLKKLHYTKYKSVTAIVYYKSSYS
jgi:hypothetical protein